MKKQHLKAALAALAIAASAVGCASNSNWGHVDTPAPGGDPTPSPAPTPVETVFTCDSAHRFYTAYLATMVVRDVSESEVRQATLAGAFLATWCGWKPPEGLRGLAPTDANEVPVLVPPPWKGGS